MNHHFAVKDALYAVVRSGIARRLEQFPIDTGVPPDATPEQRLLGFVRSFLLHIRVDVDENEALRVREGARAVAYVRGNSSITTRLSFVRIEPFIVAKHSLRGTRPSASTRACSRWLSRSSQGTCRSMSGSRWDVYIDAPPSGATTTSPSRGRRRTATPFRRGPRQ